MTITKSIKERIFLFTSILYTVVLLFPLVGYFINIDKPILSVFVTLVCFVLYPNAMNNRLVWWLFGYFCVLVTYALFGKTLTVPGIGQGVSTIIYLAIEMAFYLPNVALLCVLVHLNKKKYYYFIAVVALISLSLSFINSFVLIQQDANILRMNQYLENDDMLRIPGLPSYALMHSYVLLVPVVLVAIKKANGYKSLFCWLILACLIYLIIHTYITTTLVLTICILLFFILKGNQFSTNLLRLSGFLLVFVLLYASGKFDSLLPNLSDFYEGTAVEAKIGDISSRGSTDSYLAGRENLHAISFNSFLINPIFGYPVVGGHSNLVDRLGGMGLICFIPYIMFIISAIKMSVQFLFDKLSRTYYNLCLLCVFVLLYEKGIFNNEGWFMFLVIIPCGFITLLNNQGLTQINKNYGTQK